MTDILEFRGLWRFLSNFHPCSVEFEGSVYPSVEHAYQAAKTLDRNQRYEIRICKRAVDAKRLGSEVTLRPDWDEIKFEVMHELLEKKFQNRDLCAALIATDGQLVEGNNWHDNVWGRCTCGRCTNRRQEPGWLDVDNQLGRQLMELRQMFKALG